MTVVAGYQVYLSQSDTLTRWKGGGYGMYTTIHPHYNKITFNDSLFNKDFRKEVEESVFIKSYNDFLIYPNQNTLQSLILNTTFSDRDSLTVKIHDLEIDINNNTATYGKVIFEYNYRKNK